MTDIVNQPAHYTAGGIECIDALESATKGLEGQEAFCTANAIKYLWRWKRKNGAEDLKKARWYIERLLSALEPPPAPEIEDVYGVCETPQESRWLCRNAVSELAERAHTEAVLDARDLAEWIDGHHIPLEEVRPKGYRHTCRNWDCPRGHWDDVKEYDNCPQCGAASKGEWR